MTSTVFNCCLLEVTLHIMPRTTMVRQGLFLQFLLDLQYFFINTRLYYTHGLKHGLQEEFQYCAGSSMNVSQYRTVAFICLFFFLFFLYFFFSDLRGFVNLKWRSYLNALREVVW